MLSAFRFGRDRHLVGILESSQSDGNAKTAVIIPNAGFVHHIGPFNLHTYLSRQLNILGIPCLRFDLSGLGDSYLPAQREGVRDRKNADIDDAMDLAESKTGASSFILIGLCSGATDAHEAALQTRRNVKAVAMLDAVAYPDRLYHVISALSKLSDPGRAFRFLARKLRSRGPERPTDQSQPPPRIHSATPLEQFASEVEKATSLGVRYLFVYTGGRQYNHTRQIFGSLTPATDKKHISVEYFPQCDHTFILEAHRLMVCEVLGRWITESVLPAVSE